MKTIAIGSGKGGVGKSTVALNLAVTLATDGVKVGLLDLDVHGPNVPRMLSLTRTVHARSFELIRNPALGPARIEPLERYGVRVMSIQFLLAEDQPVAWEAPLMALVVRRLVHDVDWAGLDLLIVDLPPGTGDIAQQLVGQTAVAGALLVVTPQDVAHLDARKAHIMFCNAGVTTLGGIENMAGLDCPCCGCSIELFPPVSEDRALWSVGVERLARIPMQPSIAAAAERGVPIVVVEPDGPITGAYSELAAKLRRRLIA